jgi:hypothetical protein
MATPTVKVIADTSYKHMPTYNIDSAGTKGPHEQTYMQVTGVVGSNIKTVQASAGGNVKGLKYIHIPGYSGPG